MSSRTDHELIVWGSWPSALFVLAGGQVAIWGLSQMGMAPVGFWLSLVLIQAYVLWVSYGLIKPRRRLFFNGKSILVCDRNGRKLARIDHPRGFCSPFFIGLRMSPWRSVGLMSWQIKESDFGKLLRWMRQSSGSKPRKQRN